MSSQDSPNIRLLKPRGQGTFGTVLGLTYRLIFSCIIAVVKLHLSQSLMTEGMFLFSHP